jgi:hypothetical protein
MSDINVKIKPPGPHETISLNARKSLDGNILIFDHDIMDIVIMPEKMKIITFPKNTMGDHVYNAQDRLFDFLSKKGVILLDSIQGGNIYGSMEAKYPETSHSQEKNPVQTVLYTVSKFIDHERPYFNRLEQHLDDYEDFMLEPEDEFATDYDPRLHKQVKGSMRPGWIRTPYANTRLYRA